MQNKMRTLVHNICYFKYREETYVIRQNKNYKQNVDIWYSIVFMCIHRMKRNNNAEDKEKKYSSKFYDILNDPLKFYLLNNAIWTLWHMKEYHWVSYFPLFLWGMFLECIDSRRSALDKSCLSGVWVAWENISHDSPLKYHGENLLELISHTIFERLKHPKESFAKKEEFLLISKPFLTRGELNFSIIRNISIA